jgi:hypothetical protein
VAEWHWEPITDDLLDGLPPDALRAVEQLGKELAVRESMVFLDGPAFTGDPPGLRTTQRGPLVLVRVQRLPEPAAALGAVPAERGRAAGDPGQGAEIRAVHARARATGLS